MTGAGRAELGEAPRRPRAVRPLAAVGLTAACFVLQSIQGPLLSPLPAVNLPLLAVALLTPPWNPPLRGALLGMLAGCAFDGLEHGPVGIHGMAFTVIGFALPKLSSRVPMQNPGVMAGLCGSVFVVHWLLYSQIRAVLLGRLAGAASWPLLPGALVHAGIGMLAWLILDWVSRRADRVPSKARGTGDAGPAIQDPERLRLHGPPAGLLEHSGQR